MKHRKLLLGILLSLGLWAVVMAYTRDWDEANPTDSTIANQIDEYNRYLRVDVSDRLENMIYGFIAGETDEGFKKVIMVQEANAPSSVQADNIQIYALDDGSNCGLYCKQEDGYTKQLLKKVGTDINFVIETADIPADLIDSAHYAAGSIDAEHLAADVIDETKIADDGIDSEHYNDGSIDADHLSAGGKTAGFTPTSYNSEECIVFPNGLILKHGYIARSGATTTVTFNVGQTAFSAVVSALVVIYDPETGNLNAPEVTALTTTTLSIYQSQAAVDGYYWQVWGKQ